jgi:hypothetical protein
MLLINPGQTASTVHIFSRMAQEQTKRIENSQSSNQFIHAVKCGDVEQVKSALAGGADPNVRSGPAGDTPLLISAWQGKADIARLLIEKGANVNLADETEWHLAPLVVATACGRVSVVELLLNSKDINALVKDKFGVPVFMYASKVGNENTTQKVFELFRKKGAVEPVKMSQGGLLEWTLKSPLYACNRSIELAKRFGGRGCGPQIETDENINQAQSGVEIKTSGPLGSKTNPVRCYMPRGEQQYLNRLRCADGERPQYERIGSFFGLNRKILDGYKVKCENSEALTIFMDSHHKGYVEKEAVPGFTIDKE